MTQTEKLKHRVRCLGCLLTLVCFVAMPSGQIFAAQPQEGAPESSAKEQKPASATDPEDKSSTDEEDGTTAEGKPSKEEQEKQVPSLSDLEHHDHHGNAVDVGVFPGSIQIPGTTLALAIGGYVKVDLLADLEPAGDETLMRPDTIPLEGTPESELGPTSNIQAGQSRFNFDVRSPTSAGNFRAFIELDFFINNAPHLRHAYGTIGHLLGGQTWSTFMDIGAAAITADFGGDGMIFTRKALIRWEMPVGTSGFTWAVALEDPQSTIAFPDDLENAEERSTVPDVVGRTKYTWDYGHFQLAALVKQIRAAGTDLEHDPSEIGWGLNFTGSVDVGRRDDFKWAVAYGEGITDYVLNLSPTEPDAVLAPDGSLEVIPLTTIMLAYQHFWSPVWRSNFKVEGDFFDNQPAQTDEMSDRNWEAHVNLIYSPWSKMNIYGEYIYGNRRAIDGRVGSASRLQFSIQYLFGT